MPNANPKNREKLIQRRSYHITRIEKLAAKLLEEARLAPTIKEGLHWGHIGDLEYKADRLTELTR